MTPHSLLLSPVFLLFSDIVKSEDRQKLAKERREEKARYLGRLEEKPFTQAEHSL